MSNSDSTQTIEVMQDVLHTNKEQASRIGVFLQNNQIKSFNLMSSPGAGKTTLLERTIQAMKDKKIAVIEGDLETENDADRIRKHGAIAHQITTGSTCHLDAFMVDKALQSMDIKDVDILFIENVGNLVCPSKFEVGAQHNVVLFTATEGDDKPEKYPVMFNVADIVLITKIEAAEIMNFNLERARQSVRKVNPDVPILLLSTQVEDDFEQWIEYLTNA